MTAAIFVTLTIFVATLSCVASVTDTLCGPAMFYSTGRTTTFDGKVTKVPTKNCFHYMVNVTSPVLPSIVLKMYILASQRVYGAMLDVSSGEYTARLKLSINRNSSVNVNGSAVTQSRRYPGFNIMFTYATFRVETEFGLIIIGDYEAQMYSVYLPAKIAKKNQGLFGDCNGDMYNDPTPVNDTSSQQTKCEFLSAETSDCNNTEGKTVCALLNGGYFNACRIFDSKFESMATYNTCMSVACVNTSSTAALVKSHVEALGVRCSGSLPPLEWRDDKIIKKLNCNHLTSSVYQYDALSCQPSCLVPNPTCAHLPRRANCVCTNGTVFEKGTCVPMSFCDRLPIVYAALHEGIFDIKSDSNEDSKRALAGSNQHEFLYRADMNTIIISYTNRKDEVFEMKSLSFTIGDGYVTGCRSTMHADSTDFKPPQFKNELLETFNTSAASYKIIGSPKFHVKCTLPVLARQVFLTFSKEIKAVTISNIVMTANVPRSIVESRCTPDFPRYVLYKFGVREFVVNFTDYDGATDDILEGSGSDMVFPGNNLKFNISRADGNGEFFCLYVFVATENSYRDLTDTEFQTKMRTYTELVTVDKTKKAPDHIVLSGLQMEACLPANSEY